jgi:hypothetical protein
MLFEPKKISCLAELSKEAADTVGDERRKGPDTDSPGG